MIAGLLFLVAFGFGEEALSVYAQLARLLGLRPARRRSATTSHQYRSDVAQISFNKHTQVDPGSLDQNHTCELSQLGLIVGLGWITLRRGTTGEVRPTRARACRSMWSEPPITRRSTFKET